jgi:hypothetical protein
LACKYPTKPNQLIYMCYAAVGGGFNWTAGAISWVSWIAGAVSSFSSRVCAGL